MASTQTSSKFWLSTGASESDVDIEKNDGGDDDYDAFSNELQPQGVDPSRGWGYRGVHKVSPLCLRCVPFFKVAIWNLVCWEFYPISDLSVLVMVLCVFFVIVLLFSDSRTIQNKRRNSSFFFFYFLFLENVPNHLPSLVDKF